MNWYHDYNNQRWVSGDEGIKIRIRQIQQELKLLRGEQGQQHAAPYGVDRQTAIARLTIEHHELTKPTKPDSQ